MKNIRLRTKPSCYTPSTASAAYAPLPSPVKSVVLASWEAHAWNSSSDALADWLNARWSKSGYHVSREVICFHLRAAGKNAHMGIGDALDGAFYRELSDESRSFACSE